jgi:hypothetical protein
MRYDRTIIGYHGCDIATAELLLKGEPFRPSVNDYDWLGEGIYFWEYGPDRALRFAREQQQRGKVQTPAVVGALIQLGRCFDLMDTRFTHDLEQAYQRWEVLTRAHGMRLPENTGGPPDHKLRRRDCAVLNWYFNTVEDRQGVSYDTVRCGFTEGSPVYQGSGIYRESHVQLAVRNPAAILGVFRPMPGIRL